MKKATKIYSCITLIIAIIHLCFFYGKTNFIFFGISKEVSEIIDSLVFCNNIFYIFISGVFFKFKE